MPKIEDYHARPVSITPTGRGMQEWETTARRAGPLYNAAAQDVRERGKLVGNEIEAEGWPLNFLKAYHQLRQDNEEAAQKRLDALKPPEYRLSYGRGHGGGSSYPGGSSGTSMGGGAYAAGGIIGGAVGLSQVAAGDAYGRQAPNASKGGKLYDANTGEFTRSNGSGMYKPESLMPRAIDDNWTSLAPPMEDDFSKYPAATTGDYVRTRNDIAADSGSYKDIGSSYGDPNRTPNMWNPLNWSPSKWWSGLSGDSSTVTEGREDIR